MPQKELFEKLRNLLRTLVFLSEEEKEKFIQKASQMDMIQLQKALKILEGAEENQKGFFQNLYKKDPIFTEKFHLFSASQLRRLHTEAFYIQGRGVLCELLQQKSLWRKPLSN